MKKLKFFVLSALIGFTSFTVKAEHSKDSLKLVNWQNKDPKADKVWGVSTEQAYANLLQGKKSKTVVVAVIDNGVDINHEDLRDHIWVNEDEIPGNGIDDDNNGYIDDVHGWSFLGNSSGENLNEATLEVTRLYKKYMDEIDGVSEDSIYIVLGDEFELYQRVKKSYKKEYLNIEQQQLIFQGIIERFERYDLLVSKALAKEDYSIKELKKMKVEKKSPLDTARRFMTLLMANGFDREGFSEAIKYFDSRLNYHLNPEFNPRTIIGDDVWTWNTTAYGNNDVAGPEPDHGTAVSGIIAADRTNNIGMKGIADNVKIMSIRTVPDGDEWDKDVANAIKYAIDNGAEIINMSFGKEFSPQQEFVENILKEAAKKNVLLIHAAGNDSENNDVVFNYPRKYSTSGDVILNNWLSVGASTMKKSKKEFVAGFSNYGQTTVDIFAPGQEILSCFPNNKYDYADGTSFSSPMVAGAAALIKSYYPSLTAMEIKDILMQSSGTKNIKVVRPGSGRKDKTIVPFNTLSVSGGLLNVYKAIELAEEKVKN